MVNINLSMWTIIPEELIENRDAEILLTDERAKGKLENEVIKEPIDSVEFGRIGSASSKTGNSCKR